MASAYTDGIDVLLTDVIMPEMSGSEVAERLEIILPGLQTIFMSGYPDKVLADQGNLREGYDYLQKPFTDIVLLGAVRKLLDGSSSPIRRG